MFKTVRVTNKTLKIIRLKKLFQREYKSLIELVILNKKPIPKFITTTTSPKTLTNSYVPDKTYGA